MFTCTKMYAMKEGILFCNNFRTPISNNTKQVFRYDGLMEINCKHVIITDYQN